MMAAELFTSLQSLYTADSGAGGLANSTGNQYVRNFVRVDDTNDRSLDWPLIRVEIIEQEGDPFDTNRIRAIVKFHIWTKALGRYTEQNAIANRIRSVYHKVTPSSGSIWDFGQMGIRSGGNAPMRADQDELHYIVNAKVEGRTL